MPAGCRPTSMVLMTWPVASSTTETVPLVADASTASTTMGVPLDRFVKSAELAGRPPSLLTYANRPLTRTWLGALPTSTCDLSLPLFRSRMPSVLLALIATTAVELSATAMPAGLATPGEKRFGLSGAGMVIDAAGVSLPALSTFATATKLLSWLNSSFEPSGEYAMPVNEPELSAGGV